MLSERSVSPWPTRLVLRLVWEEAEDADGASEAHLVSVHQGALRNDLVIHPRPVRRPDVLDVEDAVATLDAGVVARHERLRQADVGFLVAADRRNRLAEVEGLLLPLGLLPDELRGARQVVPLVFQGWARRAASGATRGPSLLKSVASSKPAAA